MTLKGPVNWSSSRLGNYLVLYETRELFAERTFVGAKPALFPGENSASGTSDSARGTRPIDGAAKSFASRASL